MISSQCRCQAVDLRMCARCRNGQPQTSWIRLEIHRSGFTEDGAALSFAGWRKVVRRRGWLIQEFADTRVTVTVETWRTLLRSAVVERIGAAIPLHARRE